MAEKLDTKEFEVPKTTFSHDIETRVIQFIILQCLNKIVGVSLPSSTLIDTLFGREVEKVKGIIVEQDSKTHSVKTKIDIHVDYGIVIPKITREVEEKVVEEITMLTGFHVAAVHIVVKGLSVKTLSEQPYSAQVLEPKARI